LRLAPSGSRETRTDAARWHWPSRDLRRSQLLNVAANALAPLPETIVRFPKTSAAIVSGQTAQFAWSVCRATGRKAAKALIRRACRPKVFQSFQIRLARDTSSSPRVRWSQKVPVFQNSSEFHASGRRQDCAPDGPP